MEEILIEQQISKWFTTQIKKYGCYFMTILFLACKFLKKSIKPSQVMKIYEEAIEAGYMTFKCYIKNPAKIGTLALKELGGERFRFFYVGSERDGTLDIYNESLAEKINGIIDNIQIMWTDNKGNLHNGGHFETEGYNPDNRLRKTGKIFGKRFFYIGEK